MDSLTEENLNVLCKSYDYMGIFWRIYSVY